MAKFRVKATCRVDDSEEVDVIIEGENENCVYKHFEERYFDITEVTEINEVWESQFIN